MNRASITLHAASAHSKWHSFAVREAGRAPSALPRDFRRRFFRNLNGVIDLNAEVFDRALDLGVAQRRRISPTS